jgi:hypothetical protein
VLGLVALLALCPTPASALTADPTWWDELALADQKALVDATALLRADYLQPYQDYYPERAAAAVKQALLDAGDSAVMGSQAADDLARGELKLLEATGMIDNALSALPRFLSITGSVGTAAMVASAAYTVGQAGGGLFMAMLSPPIPRPSGWTNTGMTLTSNHTFNNGASAPTTGTHHCLENPSLLCTAASIADWPDTHACNPDPPIGDGLCVNVLHHVAPLVFPNEVDGDAIGAYDVGLAGHFTATNGTEIYVADRTATQILGGECGFSQPEISVSAPLIATSNVGAAPNQCAVYTEAGVAVYDVAWEGWYLPDEEFKLAPARHLPYTNTLNEPITTPAGTPDTPNEVTPWVATMPTPSQIAAGLEEALEAPEGEPLRTVINQTLNTQHITAPDCIGMVLQDCLAALEAIGFAQVQTVVGATDDNSIDFNFPPNHVTWQNPPGGAEVTQPATSTITIVVNPLVMPLRVPFPDEGETYAQYKARLVAIGLLGQAKPVGSEQVLPDPDAATWTVTDAEPAPGSYTQPGTLITVRVEAPTATVGLSIRPCSGCVDTGLPGIPPINFTPLTSIHLGEKFPFGVFSWVAATLGGWTGAGDLPVLTFPMPGNIADLHVDAGAIADPIMAVVRPVFLIVSLLMLCWWLATSMMGLGGGVSDD